MFQHIVGHELVVQQLTRALTHRTLSPALLIDGPIASGKCTIAMEIARVLSCAVDGAADCVCSSCMAMSHLSYPGVVLVGSRHGAAELGRVFEVARARISRQTVTLLIFSVRKCLKRVDAEFFTHTNRTHGRKILAAIAKIEERIQSIVGLSVAMSSEAVSEAAPPEAAPPEATPPESTPPESPASALLNLYTEIEAELVGILPLFPSQVSVATIRAVREWMYQPIVGSLQIRHKIAIVEYGEQLSPASANAMLKVVEETPPQTTVIFLTVHAVGMLPALRSRVREFALHRRTVEQEHEVIGDLFYHDGQHDGNISSLLEFFHTHSRFHRSIYEVAEHLVEAVEQHSTLYMVIRELDGIVSDKRFNQQETNMLLYAIRERLMRRWEQLDYNAHYTHFVSHAFATLHAMQRNMHTLHFSAKELVLTMIVNMKKGYAAIH